MKDVEKTVVVKIGGGVGRVTLAVYAASCMTSHSNLQASAFLLIIALIAVSKSNQNIINKSKSFSKVTG